MKILVVEDEKGMAQVLRRGLEEDNHAVSLRTCRADAIRLSSECEDSFILIFKDL